jgi:hypothetical protein
MARRDEIEAVHGAGLIQGVALVIGLGEAAFNSSADSVAGGLIAFNEIDRGLVACGVGPLQTQVGLSLSAIFSGITVVALTLAVFAMLIAPSPAHLVTQAPHTRI